MGILVALLLIQFAVSTLLSVLNERHLQQVAARPPAEWTERLDLSQFPRMLAYSQANARLGHAERVADLAVVLGILLSGLLPSVTNWAAALPVAPVWQGLIVLAILSAIPYLASTPWDLAASFGIERRFGFSTITVRTWLTDQLKSLLIALVIGVLLGGGLLLLIGHLGRGWWIAAWAMLAAFQILISFIAPVLILPLFNKFEPLQDQELAEQIAALARQARFPLGGVFQINASLRSRHSNAFFTGLGKTRRIALYDTLLEQHSREEILAILAHEIGHWKKRHVVKGMVLAILATGAGTALVATLLDAAWLYQVIGVGSLHTALGTVGPVAAVGLYLVSLLLSPLALLLAPAANWISRRWEYQADDFSLQLYEHATALADGLIALHEKNLANLFPHPLAVFFHYSHPPLLERVAAIRARVSARTD
ncbi:MAG: M48 family metallopeptidase [Anaerolineae bacterium]|nr:M48 family metallopeptidase [Anaerolineae bacterium]